MSLAWTDRIALPNETEGLKSRTCKTFVKHPQSETCQCGRLKPAHSYTNLHKQPLSEQTEGGNVWNEGSHTTTVSVDVFGVLSPDGRKFVRCDNRTKPAALYKLILDDCNMQKPNLLISAYGGAKYFTLSERIEKDFVAGIIDLANRADAWILTAGVNNGVANLIGEGISQYRLLKQYPKPITCIGLTKWGTLNETTRMKLKQNSPDYPESLKSVSQIDSHVQVEGERLEPNHTHYLILDNGELHGHLSDAPRANFVKQVTKDKDCYGVTIIVEGGVNTLEVVQADLAANRPVVLLQKSGRMCDVLANLIQLTTNADRTKHREPTLVEIEEHLDRFFPALKGDKDRSTRIKQIITIMANANRYLLHVYELDTVRNVSETIFQAIFFAYKDSLDDDRRARLLDLSIRWNFLEGAKQLLEVNNTKREQGGKAKNEPLLGKLLKQALEQNRPSFVDYFLRCGYDPRDLSSFIDASASIRLLTEERSDTATACQTFVLGLYNHIKKNASEHHNKQSVRLFFGQKNQDLKDIQTLNQKLRKWLGSYVHSVYTPTSTKAPPKESTPKHFKNQIALAMDTIQTVPEFTPASNNYDYTTQKEKSSNYSQQEMLRDLFLWSVFMDFSFMSKIILVHLRERIGAALIAAKIFKSYSNETPIIDVKDRLRRQATDFETYSARCVDICYEINEALTCQLLVRSIPSFGEVTCMQVAISGKNAKFLETACFDHVLNQIWYHKLALSSSSLSSKLRLFAGMVTLGAAAPKILQYRSKEDSYPENTSEEQKTTARYVLSPNGINYDVDEEQESYMQKLVAFHRTPVVKMCYHFVSYIVFLLIFSYMMLYHFDALADTNGRLHWTEYAVIIIVTTMFAEEIRQIINDLHTKMLEKWNTTTDLILTKLANPFYTLPFVLFYLSTFLHYAFGNTPSVLSAARIIMAFDLELWYLRSLQFVIALKFLGPKLFMLRNMLRDLAAFVYMIFIAIAAYGVVSRALFMYKQVPFTGRGVFENIFYSPYWFIYGQFNDTSTLDDIIHGEGSTFVAEATATQVLLAFHMLFINILLLNLLIAVFTHTIDEVQEHTEFYWRFQRYSFVREYFERPWLAYPPLIIIPHVLFAGRALWKQCCSPKGEKTSKKYDFLTTPTFKMFPLDSKAHNERWSRFENAATYGHARASASSGEEKSSHYQSNSSQPKTIEQSHEDIQRQLNEMASTLKRLTEALARSDASTATSEKA